MIGGAGDNRDPPAEFTEIDPRPVVALPRAGLPGAVILLSAVVLATILFAVLNARRHRLEAPVTDRSKVAKISSPAPLVIPPNAAVTEPLFISPRLILRVPPPSPSRYYSPPSAPTLLLPVAPPAPAAVASSATEETPLPSESALIVDGGVVQQSVATTPRATSAGSSPTPAAAGVGSTARDEAPVQATVIASPTSYIITGTVIPAVLETPIDTARPGLVRAIVSKDAVGFDGKRVLVPRGSRLIGDYASDVQGGQNRVLVMWNRLIRPDGVSIRLISPASDPLGGAGIPGRAHTFFLQRFAGALLQSALALGVAFAARPGDGSVIVGLPNSAVAPVGQQLQSTTDYRPKITVKQGAAINVFVARDLDFSTVGADPDAR